MKNTFCLDYHFRGPLVPPDAPVSAGAGGPWTKAITAAAGSPHVMNSGGFAELALDAQNEAQNLCLYWGDDLAIDIDDLIQIDIWAKASASLDASVQMAFGLAGARNDAIDSIAQATLFRLVGSNALVVEADDGTNDNDDVATGLTLSTAVRRHTIEFKTGVHTQSPPSLPTGGKSNLLFSAENSQGLLRRVAQNTRLDVSNYAGGLQPFFQVQKTAGTATGTLFVKRVKFTLRQD